MLSNPLKSSNFCLNLFFSLNFHKKSSQTSPNLLQKQFPNPSQPPPTLISPNPLKSASSTKFPQSLSARKPEALGQLGSAAAPHAEALAKLLQDGSSSVRSKAAEAGAFWALGFGLGLLGLLLPFEEFWGGEWEVGGGLEVALRPQEAVFEQLPKL